MIDCTVHLLFGVIWVEFELLEVVTIRTDEVKHLSVCLKTRSCHYSWRCFSSHTDLLPNLAEQMERFVNPLEKVFGKGRQNLQGDWAKPQSMTVKRSDMFYYCSFKQVANSWSFLLVRGATSDTCHYPVASRYALFYLLNSCQREHFFLPFSVLLWAWKCHPVLIKHFCCNIGKSLKQQQG